jgi:hypothetical protein
MLRSQFLTSLRRSSTSLRLVHQQTIARQHSSPTTAESTLMTRMEMASPSALFSAPGGRCGGGDGECEEGGGGGNGEGGGGGGTSATVGGVTIASTAIGMPVTLASKAVALLGLLVALAIVDCTEAAAAVVVWMLTPTMTLPDEMVNPTADGSTLA